jgi:hypothetical protein
MLRTSKRHWNVIKCLKMATIFSVHYPDILCRNGFVLENTIRILCTSVYPSIDELKGRNTISLCTFIFTLLPLVSASMCLFEVLSMWHNCHRMFIVISDFFVPFMRGVLDTTLYNKVCQWLATRKSWWRNLLYKFIVLTDSSIWNIVMYSCLCIYTCCGVGFRLNSEVLIMPFMWR